MPSSGIWRRVAHVRTDVSEERIALCMLQLLVVPSSLIISTLMVVIRFSETSVPTRATRRHITEDDILHSHRLESHRSYNGVVHCSQSSKLCHMSIAYSVRAVYTAVFAAVSRYRSSACHTASLVCTLSCWPGARWDSLPEGFGTPHKVGSKDWNLRRTVLSTVRWGTYEWER
jgi:hypothetical protein